MLVTRETKIKLGVFSLAESAGTATVITLVDILVCPKRLEEQGYLLRDRVVEISCLFQAEVKTV